MEENGGILTMDDLTAYQPYKRPPVTGTNQGRIRVASIVPSSSGGTHIIQMTSRTVLKLLTPKSIANLKR